MVSEDVLSKVLFQTPLKTCENESECLKSGLFPCHHCPKWLCLAHIIEHNVFNITRANELSNEINSLTHLLSNLDAQKSFDNARNKLNTWKEQTLDKIESIYTFHSNEINNFEIELNSRLNIFKESLKSTMTDLQIQLLTIQKNNEISQQQLSPIECDLNQLRRCLESVRCELSIEIKTIPFDDLINIENRFSYNRTLMNNTKIQPYRILTVENMKEFISSKNNQSILWLDTQKQLHYVDKQCQTHLLTLPQVPVKSSAMVSNYQTRKNDVDIVDIKWCSFAEVFLILSQRYLFSFDYKTQKFTQISLTRYKDYPFRCISCLNDTSLYISYCTSDICIESWRYSYNHSNHIAINECIKRWDCLTNNKNEWLLQMNTNSALHVALLIRTGSCRRFELRDIDLNFLRKVQLDNDFVDAVFPFRYHHWFIKSSSGRYYIYSTETNKYRLSSFDFPFGLQEFGMNSIIVGNKQGELICCDI